VDILTAIQSRQSIRSFLDKPVALHTVSAILAAARFAPSGVNTQPWRVVVATGQTKQAVSEAILAARAARQEPNPDYHYYPNEWHEPYTSRRKGCGLALYNALGIRKEDTEKRLVAWNNNYHFFGAPVGLSFFVESRLEKGSWLDMGMFIENVMLAALGYNLATCPQAAMAEYPDIVREKTHMSRDYALICGMALGYPDLAAPINQYRTEREVVENFTVWLE